MRRKEGGREGVGEERKGDEEKKEIGGGGEINEGEARKKKHVSELREKRI